MKTQIIIKQLPIIEQNLKALAEDIKKRTDIAKNLVCTEDTVKDIKKTRADLNKDFKEIEEQRIAIKKEVLAPYNDFEALYKDHITKVFTSADKDLKSKINEVEDELKATKEKEIIEYYEELAATKKIDFLTFDILNINITLSASAKSLKEKVKEGVEKFESDLLLIETQENKEEILIEYKKDFNVSGAIQTVTKRKEEIAKAEQARAEREALAEEQRKEREMRAAATPEKKKPLAAPTAEIKEELKEKPEPEQKEEIVTATFTVKTTIKRLKEIKKYFEIMGVDYE